MSIFITLLAFTDSQHIENAKIMILVSSMLSALLGLVYLRTILKRSSA
jgi:NhaA family Na+:H+ antiporter